jgi:hypothetical protein
VFWRGVFTLTLEWFFMENNPAFLASTCGILMDYLTGKYGLTATRNPQAARREGRLPASGKSTITSCPGTVRRYPAFRAGGSCGDGAADLGPQRASSSAAMPRSKSLTSSTFDPVGGAVISCFMAWGSPPCRTDHALYQPPW